MDVVMITRACCCTCDDHDPPALRQDSLFRSLGSAKMPVVCSAGNYGGGIYDGANYYSSHGLSYGQYRTDVGNALHRSGASAAAAASGEMTAGTHCGGFGHMS